MKFREAIPKSCYRVEWPIGEHFRNTNNNSAIILIELVIIQIDAVLHTFIYETLLNFAWKNNGQNVLFYSDGFTISGLFSTKK